MVPSLIELPHIDGDKSRYGRETNQMLTTLLGTGSVNRYLEKIEYM